MQLNDKNRATEGVFVHETISYETGPFTGGTGCLLASGTGANKHESIKDDLMRCYLKECLI